MCHRPTSLHTLLQLKHTSPRQQAAVTNNSRSELGSPAFRPAVMPGSRNSASAISVCLLLCFCCVAQSASAGRSLQTLDKDVKTETKLDADIHGGVDPKYKRVEKVIKNNDLKTQLLLAEKECKINHAQECPKVDAIKKQIAEASPPPAGETVTAPCYENVIATYFLGTHCDLPPDSKKDGKYRPAPKAKSSSGGSRRLMAALHW